MHQLLRRTLVLYIYNHQRCNLYFISLLLQLVFNTHSCATIQQYKGVTQRKLNKYSFDGNIINTLSTFLNTIGAKFHQVFLIYQQILTFVPEKIIAYLTNCLPR